VEAVGVVVNPIAGMGGRVGLHGTDGEALAAALEAGAEPQAGARMARALNRLAAAGRPERVLVAAGPMGADLLPDGWTAETVGAAADLTAGGTTADDTRAAVAEMVRRGVRLVLFGGGDGTARDVVAAVDGQVPVLGVPCGVKMHSGVFATGPEAAGEAAARFLGHPGQTREAEIVDVDESGTRLFGTAVVPRITGALQAAKATSRAAGDPILTALGQAVAAEMRPGRLYLLGPGTTTGEVTAALGLTGSPAGVDAVLDGRLLATDAGEDELLRLLAAHPEATLVLGVVGGQGFLFGRGNQQLSPRVLEAVGPDNIEIIAAAGKVAALDPPVLRIDVDDLTLRDRLVGFRRVRTSRQRSTVLRVVA
jgi:predicted polyphosphate/ATP-dependent NAD kinase